MTFWDLSVLDTREISGYRASKSREMLCHPKSQIGETKGVQFLMIYSSVEIATELDYTIVSDPIELPELLRNYWKKRNDYFPKFDDGYLVDEEGLYSITPHIGAKMIASRFSKFDTVVDGFCGLGGNTIAFAKVCKKVIAIELDEQRLELAKHNARVAGVYSKIEFIHGDFMREITKLKNVDAIFASPPWIIERYREVSIYSLNDTNPNGFEIFQKSKLVTDNIGLMLPRHTSIDDLQSFGEVFEIQHISTTRKKRSSVHFVCVYYGELIKYID